MPLIGLCGYPGAGKDTVAAHLVRRGWRRIAIGDAIREWLEEMNPVVEVFANVPIRLNQALQRANWEQLKRENPEPRRLLCGLGGLLRSRVDSLFWLRQVLEPTSLYKVVVTDVRFAREARHINDLGGHLLRVEGGESWRDGPNDVDSLDTFASIPWGPARLRTIEEIEAWILADEGEDPEPEHYATD